MRFEGSGFDAATRAAVCAAALAALAHAGGCGRGAPAGGEASSGAAARAAFAQASPAATARPAPARGEGQSPLPRPEGFVNDFAGVIDDRTETELEARLGRLKRRANIEIGVVTVETTGGQDIKDYSLAVGRGWGVGPPEGEEGGGLLLMLSVKDRRWQIQVSRRLEADLPDDVAGEIGNRMRPALREGRYGEAVNVCVDGLVGRLAERRGFPTKEDELILQALPEEKEKPAERPNAGDRRKSAPRGKP